MTNEEIIRAIRVIRHSSQRERNAGRLPSINGLAQAVGVQRQAIYRFAAGTRNPSRQTAQAIEDALHRLCPTRA